MKTIKLLYILGLFVYITINAALCTSSHEAKHRMHLEQINKMASDKLEKIFQDQGIEQNAQEAKKDANMGVANVKNTPEKVSQSIAGPRKEAEKDAKIELLEKILAAEQQQIAKEAQSITQIKQSIAQIKQSIAQIKQSIAQINILFALEVACKEAEERKVKAISSKALTLLCKSNIEIAQANKVNKLLPTSDNTVAQIQSAIKQANAENAHLKELAIKLCCDVETTIEEISMECIKQLKKVFETRNEAVRNKAMETMLYHAKRFEELVDEQENILKIAETKASIVQEQVSIVEAKAAEMNLCA